MQLRTPININDFEHKISHLEQGLVLGSCFASQMGSRLRNMYLNVCVNPFGVLFNPLSIAKIIKQLDSRQAFERSDLVLCGDLWSSFSFHSSFSDTDPEVALERMNEAAKIGSENLSKADYVILTFGTSVVYENIVSGDVVSNCHKLPSVNFKTRMLSVIEIVNRFCLLFDNELKGKRVILTVSPIRHISDGAVRNQISKSTLLLAVAELCQRYDRCCYFPSYEIMMDDLRDYRFYDRDMLHPSELAEDYIWDSFCAVAIDAKTLELFSRVRKVNTALAHRSFNPDSPSHRVFLEKLKRDINELQAEFPKLDFTSALMTVTK